MAVLCHHKDIGNGLLRVSPFTSWVTKMLTCNTNGQQKKAQLLIFHTQISESKILEHHH